MRNLATLGVVLSLLATGCSPVGETSVPSEPPGQASQALEEDNGLAFNGLAFNGLAFNGLAFNGLAFNGLSSSSFKSWFQQRPADANTFMKYLVRCALPAGQTRSYTQGPTTYVWKGGLGLAPDWTNGTSATVEEQRIVSACLAALTNKYGVTVLISVLGADARGQELATTSQELVDHPIHEGCFFGNLFTNEGLFVGNDQGMLSSNQSSPRACALMGKHECEPLEHIGNCAQSCQMDATGSRFTRCTHDGVSYPALTTRLSTQDIHTCGDGQCQFPETCSQGKDAFTCKVDCGTCAGGPAGSAPGPGSGVGSPGPP